MGKIGEIAFVGHEPSFWPGREDQARQLTRELRNNPESIRAKTLRVKLAARAR